MRENEDIFIEPGYSNICKHGMYASGDSFSVRKIKGEKRLVAVMSDGLGSGLKAGAMSSFVVSMVMNLKLRNSSSEDAIVSAIGMLPEDKEKGLSYSTCSVVEIFYDGNAYLSEYDSPEVILFRKGEYIPLRHKTVSDGELPVASYHVRLFEGDRVIIVSDGVTQSGLGEKGTPTGWGMDGLISFISRQLESHPGISSSDLSSAIVQKALSNDFFSAGDDISAAVFYVRSPRKMLVVTGPPYDRSADRDMAALFEHFEGSKVICGGSTASIIARECGRRIDTLSNTMEGADAITEGVLTLTLLCDMIEKIDPDMLALSSDRIIEKVSSGMKYNARNEKFNDAVRLLSILLDSDIIQLAVGTCTNDANFSSVSSISVEMRRNVVSRLKNLVSTRLQKKVRDIYF